jgi:hypothetical protein
LLEEKWKLRRQEAAAQEELQALTEDLRATRLALRQTRGRFNIACDPMLVEEAVFELMALQARHAYLLCQIKERGEGTLPTKAAEETPAHPGGKR